MCLQLLVSRSEREKQKDVKFRSEELRGRRTNFLHTKQTKKINSSYCCSAIAVLLFHERLVSKQKIPAPRNPNLPCKKT